MTEESMPVLPFLAVISPVGAGPGDPSDPSVWPPLAGNKPIVLPPAGHPGSPSHPIATLPGKPANPVAGQGPIHVVYDGKVYGPIWLPPASTPKAAA